ncbi:hypothetical protein RhiXN_05668 [Rhizoctonia solani]|uniref:Uncharacterized protein n=1 Tax=Rhizoctonia solani TaxID=456999 RepID=A0A8H8SWL8_9AGAM|nr:uncharacterized protein RhiXN_05668 [Rhizoctonia solani]QRW20679.1 hypothetical protein RhiXN_05668 [Rhizoctonia solani]
MPPQRPLSLLTSAEVERLAAQVRRPVPRNLRSQDSAAGPAGGPGSTLTTQNQSAILIERDNMDTSATTEQPTGNGGIKYDPSKDGESNDNQGNLKPKLEPEPKPKPQGNGNGNGKGKQVAFKTRHARGAGCGAGTKNFTVAEQWQFCSVLCDVLPRSELGWKQAAKVYNQLVPKTRQRTVESLKGKYTKLLWMKKPTGEGVASKLHEEALAIEDLLHAQEEARAIDNPWSASEDNKALCETLSDKELPPPPGFAAIPARPLPANPAPAAPPPLASAPSSSPAKNCATTDENKVIDIGSLDDSDVEVLPATQAPPKKKGSTYRASQVTKDLLPEVREPPQKRCKTAQLTAKRIMSILTRKELVDNGHNSAAGLARLEVFNRDRTIKRLERDLSKARERCHQLERQINQVTLVLTLSGIALPSAAAHAPANSTAAQTLAKMLASFLRPSPAAAHTQDSPPVPPAVPVPPTADPLPTTPSVTAANSNDADTLDDPPRPLVATSSGLSANDKDIIPSHPGN